MPQMKGKNFAPNTMRKEKKINSQDVVIHTMEEDLEKASSPNFNPDEIYSVDHKEKMKANQEPVSEKLKTSPFMSQEKLEGREFMSEEARKDIQTPVGKITLSTPQEEKVKSPSPEKKKLKKIEKTSQKKEELSPHKIILTAIIIFILLLGVGGGYYFWVTRGGEISQITKLLPFLNNKEQSTPSQEESEEVPTEHPELFELNDNSAQA